MEVSQLQRQKPTKLSCFAGCYNEEKANKLEREKFEAYYQEKLEKSKKKLAGFEKRKSSKKFIGITL